MIMLAITFIVTLINKLTKNTFLAQNPFRKLSLKKIVSILFLLSLLFTTVTGCYEGRNRPNRDNGGSNPNNPNKPTYPEHKFYFVLFEPIILSEESIKSKICFSGPQSERVYRIKEWTDRVALIAKGLQLMSERFALKPIYINPTDCLKMDFLEKRAASVLVPDNSWPDQPDDFNRPSLHIKAVFWDRDLKGVYPSTTVTAFDWPDVIELRKKNIKIQSIYYKLVSNPSWGYFTYWFGYLSTNSVLFASGIDTPDPSENGPTQRNQIIQNDTLAFFEWLKGATNEASQ